MKQARFTVKLDITGDTEDYGEFGFQEVINLQADGQETWSLQFGNDGMSKPHLDRATINDAIGAHILIRLTLALSKPGKEKLNGTT